ncbi:MAG: SRPBCC domain-containing protein [Bdellovibrionales bacterium]
MEDSFTSRLSVSRRFPVTAEILFNALTNAEVARNFMFATPEGEMVRAEVDARKGGQFVFTEMRDGEEIEHLGEYLRVDRPKLLEFNLSVPKYSEHADRVSVEIMSLGPWSEVVITHQSPHDMEEHREMIEDGWKNILEGLAKTIG